MPCRFTVIYYNSSIYSVLNSEYSTSKHLHTFKTLYSLSLLIINDKLIWYIYPITHVHDFLEFQKMPSTPRPLKLILPSLRGSSIYYVITGEWGESGP